MLRPFRHYSMGGPRAHFLMMCVSRPTVETNATVVDNPSNRRPMSSRSTSKCRAEGMGVNESAINDHPKSLHGLCSSQENRNTHNHPYTRVADVNGQAGMPYLLRTLSTLRAIMEGATTSTRVHRMQKR